MKRDQISDIFKISRLLHDLCSMKFKSEWTLEYVPVNRVIRLIKGK